MSFLGHIAFGLDESTISLGWGHDSAYPAAPTARQFIVLTEFAGRIMAYAALGGRIVPSVTMAGRTKYVARVEIA